ncbi:MAG: acylneuraminate cytidylyltransferase family protein [Paludibacter sp.]|nr:acylneuraminate cytidylyltransferase family protein [Paludibacter sp.]
MKVVAIVPIKLNNERLPNKNILSFTNGQPLVTYILNTLLRVSNLDACYVFCSNENIRSYLPTGIHFLKRDVSLDTPTTTSNDILSSFMESVDADVYLLTHATSPFIRPESIEKGIDAVLSGKYDSAIAVSQLQDFLWINNQPFNYDPTCIPRTQDLSPMYLETSGLYVFTNELFKAEKRRVGHNPYLLEVSKIEAIDIDELDDFMIADAIYNYQCRDC